MAPFAAHERTHGVGEQEQRRKLELSSDDVADLDALYNELRGQPGIRVEAVSAPIEQGDQGAGVDYLAVALSSGAVTAFLQLLRSVIEARSAKVRVTSDAQEDPLEVTTSTVEEVASLLEEQLGEA